MHYRKDADILASYGFELGLKKKPPPYPRFTKARLPNQAGLNLKRKNRMAFWVASHCPTENKREAYVQALQKFISVDIFGGLYKTSKP